MFMKSHFSPCGTYLHIALLERHESSQHEKKRGEGQHSSDISLLVATYKLCSTSPTRSPPSLVHRVRVDLDARTEFYVDNMPYTLSWTQDALYVSWSSNTLKVFRIELFRSDDTRNLVSTPKNLIYLPDSAVNSQVRFFPGQNASSPSRVVIGKVTNAFQINHAKSDPLPLISCFLTDEDLGGWENASVRSHDPADELEGQIELILDAFDVDGQFDCELSLIFLLRALKPSSHSENPYCGAQSSQTLVDDTRTFLQLSLLLGSLEAVGCHCSGGISSRMSHTCNALYVFRESNSSSCHYTVCERRTLQ